MAEEIIGSSIGEELHNQLTKREAHFAATTRNKSILEYLSSTNSWIKLRSSVNHEKSSDKAKGLVLTGGTLDKDGNMRAGISSAGTTVGAGSKAYHTSTSTGFKPMPGITGLTVKAKGTWGVLKEATVKLKVFSKEDLDDLETVYFRIGYSMLLEYGHTLYIDNDDKDIIKSATSAHCVKNTTWFGDNKTVEILNEIEKAKKNTHNNYDALYGFVSNFNWSLQSDGTYDCSIDIISKGIILEGLKNSNVTSHTKKEELENEKEEQDLKDKKSTIHYICERLTKNEEKEGNIKAELEKANAGTIGSKLEKDHPFIAFKPSVGEGESWFGKLWKNTTYPVTFISLGALLDILNTFEMMKDNKGKVICKFLIDSEEKYKTFPGHYTTNPLSVILPKPPTGDNAFAKPSITHTDESKVNDMQGNAKKAFSGKEEYITSILVSTYMVEAQVDKVLDSPTEKGTGIFEVLKSILAEVNYSLGITGLDLYYNEQDETYKIIDKEIPLPLKKAERPREIKISGLGTTVSDISVVSEINAEMKSMVSISAQATTGDYSEDMGNMLKFNKGCIDRHYYTKDQQTLTDKQKDAIKKNAEKAAVFAENFDLAWKNFNVGGTVINPEFWKDLHSEAVMNLNRGYQEHVIKEKINSGIPVPIKLNMTFKGISGFKIGSTFTVNTDIIPAKYKKYAFYVMGIDHTVAADGWKTNVSAYMKVIN